MKLSLRLVRSVLLISLCSVWAASVYAGEKKITLKQVPQAVLSAFKASYPNAKIYGTAVETENNNTYYEIESKDGTIERDILYTKDGAAFEIEESVTKADLPQAVKNSITSNFPGGEFVNGEQVSHGDTVQFDLVLKEKGKNKTVMFDSDGSIVKKESASLEKEGQESPEQGEQGDND